ncbi:MAG: PaaI family thioesterase [Alphaproteobacteria bacterium]|nr:PaaI family thioesterase [Alphaproteobacteria bacterium]
MSFVEKFQTMKDMGDYSGVTEAIPYADFLNISIREEGDGLITTMAFKEELIGNTRLPALHGGTLAALLEMAALLQLAYELEPEEMPKVITLTIDYMRSGKAQDTQARAIVSRLGRRVANVRAEAWQDNPNKPVAAANLNFLLAGDDS